MSVRAMTWAWEQQVSCLTDRALLLALADFANEKDQCFPSQDTLADRCLCSVDTIQRALKRLASAKLITREKRGSSTGGRTSDIYTLQVGIAPPALTRKMRLKVIPQNAVKGEVVKPHSSAEVKPHSSAVGTVTEPLESRLVDRPVSSNNTEQAAPLPAAAPRFEVVGKEETGTYSRLVRRTGVNPDTAEVNRDVFGPGIASSALAQLSARLDAGEAIRNPTLIFTRICEDLRREAARGVKPLTEDEKLEAYFRAQAKREGRQYMGRG